MNIPMKKKVIALLAIGCIEGFILGFLICLSLLKDALFIITTQDYLHHGMFRLTALIFQRPFFIWLIVTSAASLGMLGLVLVSSKVAHVSRSRRERKTKTDALDLIMKARWVKVLGFGLFSILLIINAAIAFVGRNQIPSSPNVVLIIVDALRADHMGCYGYHRDTTPNIDRLVRGATLFDQAVVVFPRTTPSAVSILTGLYPHTHGTRSLYISGDSYELPRNLNLAEIMLDRNYRTAAFLNQKLLHRNSGIQQGFSTYLNVEDDAEVTRQAASWLEKGREDRRPFFLFLWYLSPHWPYNPSQKDLDLFAPDPKFDLRLLFLRGKDPNQRCFTRLYNSEEIDLLISAYDAEIHQADDAIGGLLDYLREKQLYNDSLIVVTSDHGESLGEHGYYFDHGEYYYDTDTLVPLVIKSPDQIINEIVPYQVRNIDIFPTILGMLEIPYSCEGTDLFPLGDGAKAELENLIAFGETDYSVFSSNPRRYIKGTAGKWRMARTNRWKLLFIPHPGSSIYEFYDLRNDPSEENNLIDDPVYKTEIEELKKKLFKWIKEEDLQGTDGPALGNIGSASRERLKSLGYL